MNSFENTDVDKIPDNVTGVPGIVDLCLEITRIIVVVVAGVTAIISISVGATILDIILRVGLAILATGLIGWFINWLVARYTINAAIVEALEIIPEPPPSQSEEVTVEFEA